jgi:hypothetical protein
LRLFFQSVTALFFTRSYYIAEIWGADASPNFWGFFSVDGPYTLVNLMMMFVIFVTVFLMHEIMLSPFACRYRLRHAAPFSRPNKRSHSD